MSAVGTTLLHNPGWNEGESPILKPWVYTDKSELSSFRSGTHSERLVCGFAFVGKVPPLKGLYK